MEDYNRCLLELHESTEKRKIATDRLSSKIDDWEELNERFSASVDEFSKSMNRCGLAFVEGLKKGINKVFKKVK